MNIVFYTNELMNSVLNFEEKGIQDFVLSISTHKHTPKITLLLNGKKSFKAFENTLNYYKEQKSDAGISALIILISLFYYSSNDKKSFNLIKKTNTFCNRNNLEVSSILASGFLLEVSTMKTKRNLK